MLTLSDITDRHKTLSIEKKLIEKELKQKKLSLLITNRKIKNYEEARVIFTTLSKEIQKDAKAYIENITTMAIQAIFDHPYTYHLIFEEKRNTMTCTPVIRDGDNEYIPKDDQGGAMLDIIGFIQKIVLWSMQSPRSRNTMVFDEPFRFLGAFTIKAAQIVQKLSKKLGFQVIIITHAMDLANICDRVWEIENVKGVSKIKLIKK